MAKKTFEEKVKSMTAAQIIRAMVRGLRKQHVKVDMDTFGSRVNGTCFGCAATNAVCEIYGKTLARPIFTQLSDDEFGELAKAVGARKAFVTNFEYAIDNLRAGYIDDYNVYAKRYKFAQIVKPLDWELPELETDDYLEGLPAYEQLARLQPKSVKTTAANRGTTHGAT